MKMDEINVFKEWRLDLFFNVTATTTKINVWRNHFNNL